MKCLYCQGTLVRQQISYTANRQGYHLIINDVPAWVCQQCGEPMFDEATVDLIQEMLHEVDTRLAKLTNLSLSREKSVGFKIRCICQIRVLFMFHASRFTPHKSGMFRRSQAAPQGRQHTGHISRPHRFNGQPQAGKDLTTQYPVFIRIERLVNPFP